MEIVSCCPELHWGIRGTEQKAGVSWLSVPPTQLMGFCLRRLAARLSSSCSALRVGHSQPVPLGTSHHSLYQFGVRCARQKMAA